MRLAYVSGSSALNVTPAGGGAAVAVTFDETSTIQQVNVEVDADGLAVVQDHQGGTTTFTFDTSVIAPGEIVNVADVHINDPSHANPSIKTPEEDTYWGGPVKILKHAQGDVTKTLQGATFSVHANEVDAGTGANPISVGGETQFTTKADGTVLIPGLFAGNDPTDKSLYWLSEITAPAGYLPIEGASGPVTLEAATVSSPVEIAVPNAQQPNGNLPSTGGDGALLFMVAGGGLLLIAAGAAMVTVRRRVAITTH